MLLNPANRLLTASDVSAADHVAIPNAVLLRSSVRQARGERPGWAPLFRDAPQTARGEVSSGKCHMPDERDQFLARSLQYFQENIRRSGPAVAAGYTLVGAILLLGGIGYLLDLWRGTSPWFLLAGLMLGMTVGFYELAKIVWKR